MAGAAPGASHWSSSRFAWQVQHSEHLSVILRGRCSTRSTSREVRGSPATIEYYGRRLLVCGMCSTWERPRKSGDDWVLWTPAACACQVQHLEDLSLILRGRCNTRNIFLSGAALGDPPERSTKVRRRLSTVDAGCLCVASAALGGPQSHFARQVQHSEYLLVILRARCSTRRSSREVHGSPATIEYYGRRLLLHGRCSTWRTSVSFCVAGALLPHSC